MKTFLTYSLLIGLLTAAGCVSSYSQRVQQFETETGHRQSQVLPDLENNHDLSDYLRYAALNNPGLEAAFNGWKAAVERIPQAKALPDPRFTYSYFIEEVETRVGAQRQKFELSQMFPWFGTLRLKGDVAALAADAAYQRYEQARLNLFYKVKKNYYEYYYLSRSIAITKQNMKLLADLENVARSKFKTSSLKHGSIIRLQVELGRLDDRLHSLEDFRGPLMAKLNAVLNRASDSELPWPDSLPELKMALSEKDLPALLEEFSPELREMQFHLSAEQVGLALARKGYFPGIVLGLGLTDTAEADMAGVEDSGKDPVMAMIGLSIPLWPGKNRSRVREAEADLTVAEKMLENRRNGLLADLQFAFYKYRDADRKVNLYRNGLIPKAREALQVTRQSFESGDSDFLDVIDAERVLLEFELSSERALADRAVHLAELEMITGGNISKRR